MKCTRCGKEFDNTIPELNTETYGGGKVSSCPHCGKAYLSRRIIQINFEPLDDITLTNFKRVGYDDWGKKIVSDEQYNKRKKK